jgi:hypothetical protein
MTTEEKVLYFSGGRINMAEDKTLDELTELLRKATQGAEATVDLAINSGCEGEYLSLELLATIEKANAILKELDENKALLEDL